MNSFKWLSTVVLSVMFMSLSATENFNLINSEPKVPVHYTLTVFDGTGATIQNVPWKVLNQAHHEVSATVPDNGLLKLTLSAKSNGTNPTHFIFYPQPVTQGINVPDDFLPLTCYIEANISSPSNQVLIAPQNENPATRGSGTTKYGLPLIKNVTHPLINDFKELAKKQ